MGWTGFTQSKILKKFDLSSSTFHGWYDEVGDLKLPKERKPQNPRSPLKSEVEAIVAYRDKHKDVGYRKLTWMMVDDNVVYLPESAVYKVLKEHKLLYGFYYNQDSAGKEYKHKPKSPHEHWHTDIAYIKIQGVFYFLIMVLDGYSRFLLDWELMTDMTGMSVELFIQQVREKYPDKKPKLIHDNGGQFISSDFKKLLSRLDLQQVRTRRNHPQTNGKIERMNKSVKSEAIRPQAPQSYSEAVEILNEYQYRYNYQRLHAGISFLRPCDLFFGREIEMKKDRSLKLKTALKNRIENNIANSRCA